MKEDGAPKVSKENGEANVTKTPTAPKETGQAKAQPKISVQARKPAAEKKSGGAAGNTVKVKGAEIGNDVKVHPEITSPTSASEVANDQVLGVP